MVVGVTEIRCINHIEMDDSPSLMKGLFLNCKVRPNIIPNIRVVIIIILFEYLIMNICSDEHIQVIHDPEVIASRLRIRIGRKVSMIWWFDIIEFDFVRFLFGKNDMRRE